MPPKGVGVHSFKSYGHPVLRCEWALVEHVIIQQLVLSWLVRREHVVISWQGKWKITGPVTPPDLKACDRDQGDGPSTNAIRKWMFWPTREGQANS